MYFSSFVPNDALDSACSLSFTLYAALERACRATGRGEHFLCGRLVAHLAELMDTEATM